VLVDHFPIQLDGHRHEVAVGFDQLPDAGGFGVLFFALHQVQGDGGAHGATFRGAEGEFRGAVTAPVDGIGPFLVGEGVDLHLGGHHKGGVEAQTKVADDGVFCGGVLILFDEILSTGEGHLVDVLLHLVSGHADAGIGHAEGFLVLIQLDFDFGTADIAVVVPGAGRHGQLLDGVYGVGNQLPQEDFVLRVKGFFNNRKNILGMNRDIALFQNRGHGGSALA
jgi:hypothetical protein